MLLDTALASNYQRPRTESAQARAYLDGRRIRAAQTLIGAITACALALAVTVVGADARSLVLANTAPTMQSAPEVSAAYRIESVSAAENQLFVSIANESGRPLRGDLAISVDGGRPTLVHGAALPLSGNARIPLDGVVVQRRSHVTFEVRSADGRSAQTLSATLAPDAPNDIELASARILDGVLVAEVRNNSPIPLVGSVVVAAREPVFPYTMLARIEATLDVQAGGSQQIHLGHVGAIDVGRTWIGLTTDAIEDANIGNNVLGR